MTLTPLEEVVLKAEYRAIRHALKKTYQNKTKAAELLQIDKKTLYNKVRKYHRYIGSKEQQAA